MATTKVLQPSALVLVGADGETYCLRDLSRDFHCQHGLVKSADLLAVKETGGPLTTHTGYALNSYPAQFSDMYGRIKRDAQIIIPKDAGYILATTLVGRDSVCVDAGGGSGALTLLLAHYVKHVHCFDNRADHIAVVEGNARLLGISNITVQLQDIYEGIPVTGADLVTLDVPEPGKAIAHVIAALKVGGWFVAYVPHAHQMQAVSSAVLAQPQLHLVKSLELIERHWTFDDRRARPESQGLMHTGFLLFARKIAQ
jgi:tRNA (adenine57-N1/adenine58-N1)-methyltransferase